MTIVVKLTAGGEEQFNGVHAFRMWGSKHLQGDFTEVTCTWEENNSNTGEETLPYRAKITRTSTQTTITVASGSKTVDRLSDAIRAARSQG